MTVLELLILLLIAAVVGTVAQSAGGYWRGGLFLAIVLGVVGPLVGTWLARSLGLPELLTVSVGGVSLPIVWAILGAVLVVGLASLLAGGRGRWGRWGSITPPRAGTLLVAIALSLPVSSGILSISVSAYTLMAIAFLVLLLGNLVRGL